MTGSAPGFFNADEQRKLRLRESGKLSKETIETYSEKINKQFIKFLGNMRRLRKRKESELPQSNNLVLKNNDITINIESHKTDGNLNLDSEPHDETHLNAAHPKKKSIDQNYPKTARARRELSLKERKIKKFKDFNRHVTTSKKYREIAEKVTDIRGITHKEFIPLDAKNFE